MTVPKPFQSALYLDLEVNCADRFMPGAGDPEILEIGLAELDLASLKNVGEANYLVRPQRKISRRCSKITGLTEDDFRGAKAFREVVVDIRSEWREKATGIALGGSDGALFTRACQQLPLATPFRRFIDLSQIVRQAFLLQNQLSVRTALELLGLSFDGCAHTAVADARNTARIHAEIVRRLRVTNPKPAPPPELGQPAEQTWFAQVLERNLNTTHTVRAAKARTSKDRIQTGTK